MPVIQSEDSLSGDLNTGFDLTFEQVPTAKIDYLLPNLRKVLSAIETIEKNTDILATLFYRTHFNFRVRFNPVENRRFYIRERIFFWAFFFRLGFFVWAFFLQTPTRIQQNTDYLATLFTFNFLVFF